MAMSVVYGTAFGGIISENRGGTVSVYVPDTLGSTIGLMNSAGTLTDSWTYWPYGEVRTRTGSNVTPFTFLGIIGYFQDVLSKLSYVRARFLKCDLARWLTVDPLWPSQPAYGYVENNPLLATDGSGLGNNSLLGNLKEGCTYSGSGQRSVYKTFGIVTEIVVTFSYCICCGSDIWTAIGGGTAGAGAILLWLGIEATGGLLAAVGGALGVAFGICYVFGGGGKSCIQLNGVIAQGAVNSTVVYGLCCVSSSKGGGSGG